MPGQLSEADAARVTFAAQVVAILFTDTTGATVIMGDSASVTTMFCVAVVVLLCASVTVQVIVVVPTGKLTTAPIAP